jgi:ATP synthase protein I
MWKQASRLGAVGLEMGLAIAIGAFGGRYVDGYFKTEPLFFWIGLVVGSGAAVKAFLRAVREARKLMEQDEREPKARS